MLNYRALYELAYTIIPTIKNARLKTLARIAYNVAVFDYLYKCIGSLR